MNRENMYKNIVSDMTQVFLIKDKAYGSSTTDTFNKFGLTSYLVRLNDKLNRLTNLTLNPDISQNDESIQDTLLDLANYCILALIDINQSDSNHN